MKLKTLIPMLLIGLTSRVVALEESLTVATKELITLIQEDIDANGGDQDRMAAMAVRQLQNALDRGNSRQIESAISENLPRLKNEKITQAATKVREALSAERKARAEAILAEFDRTRSMVAEKLARATKPEDLDDLLASLQEKNFNNRWDDLYEDPTYGRVQNLAQRMAYIRQMANTWQDYLDASNRNDPARAILSLTNLLENNNGEANLIPRSQILARLDFERKTDGASPEEQALKVVEGIRSLDDMKGALSMLGDLQKRTNSRGTSGGYSSISTEYVAPLSALERSYRDFLSGLPVGSEALVARNYPGSPSAFSPLRAQLLMKVFPRLAGEPDDAAGKPGETFAQLVDRFLSAAAKKEDFEACARILNAAQIMNPGGSRVDLNTIEAYLSAQNQIAAGQFSLAVASLQKSLHGRGSLLPIGKIGAQLAAIKKDHPGEYEEGMRQAIDTP